MKWFTGKSLYRVRKSFYLLPTIVFSFNKSEFLETGVFTPAFSLKIVFLKWAIYFWAQKAY
jgi:hypothetical protein